MVEANASSSSFVHASPELVGALREAYAVEESKFEIYEERQSYTPKSRTSFSFSDPDATMAGKERQGGYAIAKPRYKNHRVVDERCAVITAVETTPGHIFDGSCLVALTEQHHRTTGIGAETVVADQHYGTRENIRALQAQGIRTHMKVIRATGLTEKRGIFHASDFRYEPATDTCRCPANQTLPRRSYDRFQRGWIFRANVHVCRACPMRAQCTTASIKTNSGRAIIHPDGYDMVVKGCEQANSLEAKRDRRRRMTLMEGSFGQASQNHRFKRARWRRLWRQRIQDHLIAAVQNVKKMIAYGPPLPEMASITPKPSPEPASSGRIGLKNALAKLESVIRLFLSGLMPCFP